jgi:hypothetical protein
MLPLAIAVRTHRPGKIVRLPEPFIDSKVAIKE